MVKLKSIFISTMLLYMVAISFYALYQYIAEEHSLSWLSLSLANLIPSVFIGMLFIIPRPRTTPNLNLITVLITVSTAVSLYFNISGSNGYNHLISLFNTLTVVSWLLYIFWYSKFRKRKKEKLSVGSFLPEFDLEDSEGNKTSANEFIGKPSIFMFYRGNWCPLCMAQISEISQQYKALVDRGTQVVLVSPQPHSHTKSLSKKYDVPFHFMVDVGNKAAKKLNIFSKGGTPLGMEVFGYSSDTVMPTVVITNRKGKIIFADLTDNYRIRPEPSTFIEVLDKNTA